MTYRESIGKLEWRKFLWRKREIRKIRRGAAWHFEKFERIESMIKLVENMNFYRTGIEKVLAWERRARSINAFRRFHAMIGVSLPI